MSKVRTYFFDNTEDLVKYIKSKLSNPTPLKIQKSLYFLWAFYAATYGRIDYSVNSEFQTTRYPKLLFKGDFEAWKYGPVLSNIYAENKYDDIAASEHKTPPADTPEAKNVWSFIDDMLDQIDPVNDFGLVARSHEDSAWKKAYKPDQRHCKMDQNEIIKDYIGYVNEQ